MARKRVIIVSNLKDWDEVNEALRKIAEKQSNVDAKVSKYNEAEARRRKSLDDEVNPVKNEITDLEENIRLFAEEHREDFGKKKSKEMANGIISFRTGTPKAKTLKGFTWAAVLELVKKSLFKEDYLRVKQDINKEKIIQDFTSEKVDAETLKEIGVEVVQTETFGYEVKIASGAA